DALVITGLIGFLAYMFVFGSLFYYGFKWLGLIRDARQRNIFFGLLVGGGLAGALFLYLWRGPEFIGVGLPVGIALGLAGYLVVSAFAFYGQEEEAQGEAYQPLLIALLSGFMAHFIEIHFGIAIAATRTYFWVYAALMVVIGYYLRRRPVAEAPAKRPRGQPSKRRKRRSPKSLAQTMDRGAAAIIASSLPVGMILATMGFDYLSPQFNLAAKRYSMLWLFFLTWALGGGIVLAEAALKRRRAGITSALLYVPVSLGCLFVFYTARTHQLSTLMALANRGDALGAANAEANLIVVYYAVLFFLLLGMAGALAQGSKLPSQSWRRANWWLYPILMAGVVALIFTTNINVIKADIVFKQAGQYEGAGNWDTGIAIYRRAIELTPNEDYYYLFLGRAYLEKAKATSEPDQRPALFEESRKTLERACQLNPLNTDHSANLARLYRTWGEMASDPAERAEKLSQALEYYRQATTLSPHNALLFNEWGTLCYFMGEHEKALEKYQQSLSLDPEYDQTHLLLGDLHLNRKEFDEAAEAYRRALDINPNLTKAHSALGYIYAQQGKLQKAMEENLKVVELAPNNYDSHKNLALIYRDLGRPDKALAEARIALELAPEGDKQSLEALVAQLGGEQASGSDEELVRTYLSQGRAYLAEKDLERAEEAYLRALELNPNIVQPYSALGYIYAHQGRLEEAVEANLKVLELAPNDYDSHKNLAILYQQLGRIDQAIAAAQTALELAPE
ncbi:MAG: tetratricopeptide repeat protein, partial [Chloroflexota bacterium]|nr:tetratricopeptide repeat protein [Chloroflexota bacterium]